MNRLFLSVLLIAVLVAGAANAREAEVEARPDFSTPVEISDAMLYREIFYLQDAGLWNRADRLIAKLENTEIMGHVLFQRYMHPHSYRARWTELRDWLKNYADQPGAWQVYKLALKRKPRGIAMPKQPPERVYYNEQASALNALFTRRSARAVKREVYNLVQRERPTQALRYINRRTQARRLSRNERDHLQSLIARSYYIERKVETSLKVAQKATRSRRAVPLADWHAGLAAYRLKQMELALSHFQELAYNPVASEMLRARGAFWAGRALRHLGNNREAESYFRQAAKSGGHFYSLLAMTYIAPRLTINWERNGAPIDDLLITHPAVRRAELLQEAGESDRAQRELLYLQERASINEARALLTYAEENNYPAVQLALAARFAARGEQTRLPLTLYEGSYPAPDLPFDKDEANVVDKALLLALIRQESRFKTNARSSAGARGLMQIMPRTAAFISGNRALARRWGRDRLLDAELNLELGQRYLLLLMNDDHFSGNLIYTLAAYNAGPGTLRRWQRELADVKDPLLFVESLPAAETRAYVQKVLGNLWIYRSRLGQDAPSLRQLAAESWPQHKSQDKR